MLGQPAGDAPSEAGSVAVDAARELRRRGYAASVGMTGGCPVVLRPSSAEALVKRLAALEAEVAELRKPPY
jgi:hypothetical protein